MGLALTSPVVPADLGAIADPRFVLLAWAAGLALVAGSVSLARVVGPGFTWLATGTAAVVGLAGVLTQGAVWARIAAVLLLIGAASARKHLVAGPALLASGAAFLVEAGMFGGWPAVTAGVALGGVTGEMMLGHWYLVDPRLPRWTLRSLAAAGMAGLAADGAVLGLAGGMGSGGGPVAFWVLLGTSIALMAAVIGALRQPAYSGVMAATGLSYLAVLTSLGAVFLGRNLVAGLAPFTT